MAGVSPAFSVMDIILNEQAKSLAKKDRIPINTIGAYQEDGVVYYWVHTEDLFDFGECVSVKDGLDKAKKQCLRRLN